MPPLLLCTRKKSGQRRPFRLSVRVQITGISKSRPQTLAKPTFRQADATETLAAISRACCGIATRISTLGRLAPHQRLERGANRFGKGHIRCEPLHGRERLLFAVAERHQRVYDVGAAAPAGRLADTFGELALQLEQQPLGGLLADARDLDEAACV